MPNTDHGPVIYRFTLDQIKQAAQDIKAATKLISNQTDIIGAISQVVGRNRHGVFDSRAVIAESIIMHYLGMHPYAWEDWVEKHYPMPDVWKFDTNNAAGFQAYSDAQLATMRRRVQHVGDTLNTIIEWLNSDRFTGGTDGPAADPEEAQPQSDRAGADRSS
jgi:hypothetical protein